jgi:hypothetical protein
VPLSRLGRSGQVQGANLNAESTCTRGAGLQETSPRTLSVKPASNSQGSGHGGTR